MNSTVDAVIAPLRSAFTALSPPINVYRHSVPDLVPGTQSPVIPPYAYIYSGDELLGAPYYGRRQDLVTLHLFARSKPELQLMQDGCVFLDEYRAPTTGSAYAPFYNIQSKSQVEETDGVWHAAHLFTVDYTDARLFS